MEHVQMNAVPSVAVSAISAEGVRRRLRRGEELVLADVREEAVFAVGHPLWAANFPLSRLEFDSLKRIPRRDTLIVVYGDKEVSARRAIEVLVGLGFTDVRELAGGLVGWVESGGELFADVNSPSKAFGELVESVRQTPAVTAVELQALINANADLVVVDARRVDEFRTMSIPTARSVPGAELVLRIGELVPNSTTQVVVNCAGRTRSIIGAQSLINAGLSNPVAALRNGTMGWTLAGQSLDHGAQVEALRTVSREHREAARLGARDVATRAGVRFVPLSELEGLFAPERTTYLFDVRTEEEFLAGHLPGAVSAPGGQLVQETDHHAPVRGARIVLSDDDGVRATMTASWLAQMGWEAWVLEKVPSAALGEVGRAETAVPAAPGVTTIGAGTLAEWLDEQESPPVVLDVGLSADYVRGHVPGAWHVSRSRLSEALDRIPAAERYVLTSESGRLAPFAAAELQALTEAEVVALADGSRGWRDSGAAVETGPTRFVFPPTDRYRRPYEGNESPRSAMEAYLEWEYGLVAQLERDGTHGFHVV